MGGDVGEATEEKEEGRRKSWAEEAEKKEKEGKENRSSNVEEEKKKEQEAKEKKEWSREAGEKRRQRNIVVKGLDREKGGSRKAIKEWIEEILRKPVDIGEVKEIRVREGELDVVIIEILEEEDKERIMEKRSRVWEMTRITIDRVRSFEERKARWMARQKVGLEREMREKGRQEEERREKERRKEEEAEKKKEKKREVERKIEELMKVKEEMEREERKGAGK